MRYIYLDEAVILNFGMDLALIILTARISSVPYSMRRAVPAALLGALWAVCAEFFEPLRGPALSLLSAAAIVLTAFGFRRETPRLGLVFLAVSAAFAGLGSVSGGSAALLISSFLCAYFIYFLVFSAFLRNKVQSAEYFCRVSLGERSVTFTALADTGNTLRDPIRGLPVTICSLDAVEPLFDRETAAVLRSFGAVEAVERLRGFSLIPYRSVGGDGFLPAFVPGSVTVNGKPVRCAIAVDPRITVAALSPVQEV